MPALLLLLLAGLAQTPPPETFAIGTDEILYRIVVRDSTAVLASHGEVSGPLFLEVPRLQTATDSFSLPLGALLNLAERAEAFLPNDAPDDLIGFGIDGEQLRIVLSQGVPVWGAATAALAFLAFGGLAVGVVLTRRDRRRRRTEAIARQRALHAREAERTRIARDLHDGPLQDVHALRLLGAGEAGVADEAGRIARELRAIAEGLRPPALGRFGLAAALSAHANRVKDRYPDVAVGLDLDEDGPDALPDVVRAALFRIAQEAITNAVEHGGARRVRIALTLPASGAEAPADIVLEVTDDGAGFQGPPPDLAALADAGHFGLVGMHERAEAVGGALTIRPGGIEGRGTRVRAVVPAPRATARPPFLRRLAARPRAASA